jgi:hypothetical protein
LRSCARRMPTLVFARQEVYLLGTRYGELLALFGFCIMTMQKKADGIDLRKNR